LHRNRQLSGAAKRRREYGGIFPAPIAHEKGYLQWKKAPTEISSRWAFSLPREAETKKKRHKNSIRSALRGGV
jgi:hypothetical protein